MPSASAEYIGNELALFAIASNWKAYMREALQPYINGAVVEVGAGLGETARVLRPNSGATDWICVEPDPAMAQQISNLAEEGELGSPLAVHTGTLKDLPPSQSADTILYIDVLEHIEGDKAELLDAAGRLRAGGRIVVLSPAYPFLYSPFDKAIGHFRRYTGSMLRTIAPECLVEERLFYLDSVGALASAANRLLLRQAMPTSQQIRTWDRRLVPLSRLIDPLIGRRAGRSVIAVWRKA